MKTVLIGAVQFSRACLAHLIRIGAPPIGVVSSQNTGINSDYCRLDDLCEGAKIPFHATEDVNSAETVAWLRVCAPDVIFCFGWSRLLHAELLAVPLRGVVGYHPALLPQNRGRHPIIWALVLGLEETGSTFYFMDEGADTGDILSQRRIAIAPDDDAGTVYSGLTDIALTQIEEFLPRLADGTAPRQRQDNAIASTWRKRGAADGRIDWRMPTAGVHNLVRGLAPPYPGATVRRGDEDQIVWRTRIDRCAAPANIEPGKVVMVREREVVVKTGDGAITLLKHELDPMPSAGDYL